MVQKTLAAGPSGRIGDLWHVFDRSLQPVFMDFVHINEIGNRIVAEQLAPIWTRGLP